MSNISEQERFRRGEYARDSRAALAQTGNTPIAFGNLEATAASDAH